MPDIVRANVRYCLNLVRSLCCCLDIVSQGVGHCKSERTVLFKRCTFAMLLFRHCFKRTYAWQGQFHRDYKRIEAASDDESRDKLNKSNGGPGI